MRFTVAEGLENILDSLTFLTGRVSSPKINHRVKLTTRRRKERERKREGGGEGEEGESEE
jgi:hypothetical protein